MTLVDHAQIDDELREILVEVFRASVVFGAALRLAAKKVDSQGKVDRNLFARALRP
jgi:Cdc6-like AAA superfamily ATPase